MVRKISHLRLFAGIVTWLAISYLGTNYAPEGLWYVFGIAGFILMIIIIYFYELVALVRRLKRWGERRW
ncbi:MAG: hypothetical protein QXL94_01375 [Candidatus Parvarchaeum sp.]